MSFVLSYFFDSVDLGLDFPGQTEETQDPGQHVGVSYSETQVYQEHVLTPGSTLQKKTINQIDISI